MAAGLSSRTIVVVVVAAVAAAGLGYWGYGAYKTRELRGAVGTVLKGAGERMREALSLQAGQLPPDRAEATKQVEGHVAALDKSIDQFKRLPLGRDRALTDAADSYLVTVREILRTQARMYRAYRLHTESLDSLRDHLRVDDRRGAWVTGAVRSKERAERDFRDYRLANSAYATLLGSFPTEQKKIESAVPREGLAAPDQITRARERAIAVGNESAAEMDKVRKLVGPK
jgi:hypothetical protein